MTSSPSPAPAWAPRTLVSIHGINSDGAWQTRLHSVFSPHYQHVPLGYPQYRRLGATKILLEPWALAACALILAGVIIMWRPSAWQILATVLLGLLLAHAAAGVRRGRAYRHVVRRFDAAIPVGVRAHVVAHSFGTFLCGRLMQRPATRCDRLVFAGSVLARDFVASRMRGDSERPFSVLRNEVGLRDRVVMLAGLIRRLVRDLGDAGLRGFTGPVTNVHDLPEADSECGACQHTGSRAGWLVHNVQLTYFAHDDQFITEKHALAFWLPFLWDIEPKEFTAWLEWCRAAASFGAPGDLGQGALEAERQLLLRQWKWAGGVSLEEFLRREFPAEAARLDDALERLRLFRALWQIVTRACDLAVTHDEDPRLMAQARALDPRAAVQSALAVVAPL